MCSLEINWSAPPTGSEAERRLEMYLIWSDSEDASSLNPAAAASDATPDSGGQRQLADVNCFSRENWQASA
jgi:hypothetical protein